MNISIINREVNKIPVLELVEAKNLLKPLPIVLYLHGHTSNKYNNINNGYALAEKGYRVVLIDLPYHGDRKDDKNPVESPATIAKIFKEALNDLELIHKHYLDLSLIKDNKVALVGESLGGMITNIALCKFDWISLAVPLMASPTLSDFLKREAEKELTKDWEIKALDLVLKAFKNYDLSLNPEKLDSRPVLMWNDFEDEVVPYQQSYNFYMEVKDNDYAKNLKIVNTNGSGHRVSSEVRYIMRDFIVENM